MWNVKALQIILQPSTNYENFDVNSNENSTILQNNIYNIIYKNQEISLTCNKNNIIHHSTLHKNHVCRNLEIKNKSKHCY